MIEVWIIYGLYMICCVGATVYGQMDECEWKGQATKLTLISFFVGMAVAFVQGVIFG